MRYPIVLGAAVLAMAAPVQAEPRDRSVEVVFGSFGCSVTLVGRDTNQLSATLSFQGTVEFSPPEGLHLRNVMVSEEPLETCEDSVTRFVERVETLKCSSGIASPAVGNRAGIEARGVQFVCVGPRNRLVKAVGSLGAEFLAIFSAGGLGAAEQAPSSQPSSPDPPPPPDDNDGDTCPRDGAGAQRAPRLSGIRATASPPRPYRRRDPAHARVRTHAPQGLSKPAHLPGLVSG